MNILAIISLAFSILVAIWSGFLGWKTYKLKKQEQIFIKEMELQKIELEKTKLELEKAKFKQSVLDSNLNYLFSTFPMPKLLKFFVKNKTLWNKMQNVKSGEHLSEDESLDIMNKIFEEFDIEKSTNENSNSKK